MLTRGLLFERAFVASKGGRTEIRNTRKLGLDDDELTGLACMCNSCCTWWMRG